MTQHDTFRPLLRALPGWITRLETQRGTPLVVELPKEPPEHARRLLDTLGVTWTLPQPDPLAATARRWLDTRHGPLTPAAKAVRRALTRRGIP